MLFITSTTQAALHGVYALRRRARRTLAARGTGTVAIVGQFPWGPDGEIIRPGDMGEAKEIVAPKGFDRTGSAYLTLLGKVYPQLLLVRVLGAGAAHAEVSLPDSAATNVCKYVAKYKGAAGNGITATVSNASDGDADHFNVTFSKAGATADTTETYPNRTVATGETPVLLSTAEAVASKLVGAGAKLTAGRPANGTYVLAGGSDGTVTAADYVGTSGTGDKGVAMLEGEPGVRHICTDYPGGGLLAAVNAGLVQHAALTGDRFVHINGPPGQSASAVLADKATYTGFNVIYHDPWVYLFDDTTGAEHLVPPAPFGAALAANLSPSTSFAWKSAEARELLSGIVRLESSRGLAAATNEKNGISTLGRARVGSGHVYEAAVTLTGDDYTNVSMDIYIATAFVDSVYEDVDSPNVALNRDEVAMKLDGFLSTLKRNQQRDPNHTPHVVDYALVPLDQVNMPETIEAGEVYVAAALQYSSGMKRIFLMLESGTAAILQV
jgi:hypothetical protein